MTTPVPINFKCRRDAELPRARRQFVFQINQNGFGFATRSADVHIHFLPRAVRQFCFQCRKRKWQIRVERGCDVRHAAAKTQPVVQRQNQRAVGRQFAKIHRDRKRLGQSAQLRFA